jgi:hypothetical protein
MYIIYRCLFLMSSFVSKELTNTKLPGLHQTTRTVVVCRKLPVVTEQQDLPPFSDNTATALLRNFTLSEMITLKILLILFYRYTSSSSKWILLASV